MPKSNYQGPICDCSELKARYKKKYNKERKMPRGTSKCKRIYSNVWECRRCGKVYRI